MNRMMMIVVGLSVALASLCFTAQAHGENVFNVNSYMTVNPDFASGSVWSYGGTQNAVVTSMSGNMSISFNEESGMFFCDVTTTLSGVWGTPGDNNPYYDFLKNGVNCSGSSNWTQVEWNGKYYEFNDTVSVNYNTLFYLFNGVDGGNPVMTGWFNSNANGTGMVPIGIWTNSTIYEPGHPEWLPDWQVYISSTWLITSDFQVVPAPGAIALLGLAGLMTRRRR